MYGINSSEKNEIQDLLTNIDNIPKIIQNCCKLCYEFHHLV